MLIIIGFVVIILISFLLAYRSMKDYREHPPKKIEYGTFLVRSPGNFSPQVLSFIASQTLHDQSLFSIEYLHKGDQKALILYIPKHLVAKLSPLHPLEIEDPLERAESDYSALEFHLPQPQNTHLQVQAQVFSQIKLIHEDFLCFQVVCQIKNPPAKLISKLPTGVLLQIHPKVLFYSKSQARSKVLSEITQLIEKNTNMRKSIKPHSSGQIHSHAEKRNLVPFEIEPFLSSPQEIVKLVYS